MEPRRRELQISVQTSFGIEPLTRMNPGLVRRAARTRERLEAERRPSRPHRLGVYGELSGTLE
jgi:hypothetical protein